MTPGLSMQLRSAGSFIDAELLARAQGLGLRIVQFGVDYVPRIRGTSTLARPRVVLQLLAELIRNVREIRALEPPPARIVEVRRAPPRLPLRRVAAR